MSLSFPWPAQNAAALPPPPKQVQVLHKSALCMKADPSLALLRAAGSQSDCVGNACLVQTFDFACCADGFACLSGLPSPTCQPSPYPVVPPYLQNPKLLISSSAAAGANAAATAISTVFPSRDPRGAVLISIKPVLTSTQVMMCSKWTIYYIIAGQALTKHTRLLAAVCNQMKLDGRRPIGVHGLCIACAARSVQVTRYHM